MGNTIFMIHGMWGGPWHWQNYKAFLGKDYHCITPTLRFHDVDPGNAPPPQLGSTSLLDYADDLELEVTQLDTKPILIGHSMGGLLAQILASRGLARAIVLLMPCSPAGINAIRPSVVKSIWSVQTKWGFWKRPMRQTFNEAVYSLLSQLPENEQKETYSKFVYESGRVLFEIGYWPIDAQKASRVDESKVTCPVLVIAGRQDKIVPESVVRNVARKYKHVAHYKVFENQAHWALAGPNWREIAEYVEDWLNQQLTDSGV